jgi:PAS domain-containing protein
VSARTGRSPDVATLFRDAESAGGGLASRPYAHGVDVKLHAFPSRDREFREFVEAAFADMVASAIPAPTTEQLRHALRARYPAAVVTQQAELARHGDGPIVWYAFRTAAIGVPEPSPSPSSEPENAAWAMLDDERRFVDVSPALARIVELQARRLLGHRIEDFSNPADPTIRDDIARLWAEFRSSGALSSSLRFNYADGRPRELAYRLEADAGGEGRHKLTVQVLPPEA